MTYAIIEASGRQLWVEPGRFYDINKISGEPGDIVRLKRILMLNRDDKVQIGHPCLANIIVEAKILKHLRGRKVTVFKMKPKKNTKSKQGHRQDLTRLLIQRIS
uniref:50S ribosomal protein L21, chloroplastic n=1 Tax=Ahnfeltia plicata TaxID=28023 RepID=A0A1C9CB57_9FLOR|nr:ribosomal protein L21 [Ahnfeltia plicata]AOM65612.1 ribosomal protein L21 [Ahnfeltia plicata]UAT97256.1 ribosomal protein L21 [Ahnfeltia plicata]UAT97461.1 ribosomal protein L21 [Ahnfeltia plicata]